MLICAFYITGSGNLFENISSDSDCDDEPLANLVGIQDPSIKRELFTKVQQLL